MPENKYKNIPHTYNGVKYKSGLEVYCKKIFEESGIILEYEKVQLELIPRLQINGVWEGKKKTKNNKEKNLYENKSVLPMKYTPDFTNENLKIVIECKGRPNDAFPLRWKIMKANIHNNKYKEWKNFFLVTNKKQIRECLEIIKKLSAL